MDSKDMVSKPSAAVDKLHAVCLPVPAQGHISPMLKIAKLLHFKGFHITFVNTEYNHRRLLKSRGPDSVSGLSDFCFKTIPDGLPLTEADAVQNIPYLSVSISSNCLAPFRELLCKLNDTATSRVPPVTCIISDFGMDFSIDAAEEFGIPVVSFVPNSAASTLSYMQSHQLVERGLMPIEDASYLTNGYLETTIDWIPGMKNIRLKDLPIFFGAMDLDGIVLDLICRSLKESNTRASAIILNTFDSFEREVLDPLRSILYPPVYTIGPLHLLVDRITNDKLKYIGSNLWKEQSECIEWLDSKEPNSVVYVNFGSITVLTSHQLTEFAWGLADSKKPFLWIIRPDLVANDEEILPAEFLTETKDRGMLASWCPQEQILKHPSVGGFLSHMGWNSTIESVCGGVPLICWPFFADQPTNCWFACTQLGIGVEINNNVKRDEVTKLVKELMEGEKGKEMKKKAMELKAKAEEATGPGGCSHHNLDELIKFLKAKKR